MAISTAKVVDNIGLYRFAGATGVFYLYIDNDPTFRRSSITHNIFHNTGLAMKFTYTSVCASAAPRRS